MPLRTVLLLPGQYKGITVCGEWQIFETFFNWAKFSGYKLGLTIDRVDPFGNYEPGNCRWITIQEQQRNRKHHVIIVVDGIARKAWEWEEITGIPAKLIRQRIQHGWDSKRAVSERVRRW